MDGTPGREFKLHGYHAHREADGKYYLWDLDAAGKYVVVGEFDSVASLMSEVRRRVGEQVSGQ